MNTTDADNDFDEDGEVTYKDFEIKLQNEFNEINKKYAYKEE